MSWDLSSEEVIIDKLESQQRLIFAFTNKIKKLEAENASLKEKLKVAVEVLEEFSSESDMVMYKKPKAGGQDKYAGLPFGVREADKTLAKIQEDGK